MPVRLGDVRRHAGRSSKEHLVERPILEHRAHPSQPETGHDQRGAACQFPHPGGGFRKQLNPGAAVVENPRSS
jgi:hypothetical protein